MGLRLQAVEMEDALESAQIYPAERFARVGMSVQTEARGNEILIIWLVTVISKLLIHEATCMTALRRLQLVGQPPPQGAHLAAFLRRRLSTASGSDLTLDNSTTDVLVIVSKQQDWQTVVLIVNHTCSQTPFQSTFLHQLVHSYHRSKYPCRRTLPSDINRHPVPPTNHLPCPSRAAAGVTTSPHRDPVVLVLNVRGPSQ